MKNRVRDSFAVGVGKRLQIAREAAGYSQADLARALGVDAQRLSHWELGKHHLPGVFAHAIFREIRIDAGWLYSATSDRLPVNLAKKVREAWRAYERDQGEKRREPYDFGADKPPVKRRRIKPNPRLRDVR